MRSSLASHFTDRFGTLTALRALDLAYLVVLPPILLLLKAPMLLFTLFVGILLLTGKKGTPSTLSLTALLGIAAVFFSLYGAFNFAGLSRLKLFVELMVYLLLLAVALQRLTREINFYLIVSPMLLLALSLFFFDSVWMLGYVVFEIFILLWIILAYRMRASAAESLRMTGMLFGLSLPWVVLLFLFFPRISFEHASYGFRGDELRRTGHDGRMYLDNHALLVPSERIVMEVGFGRTVPDDSQLYFRGSVLYLDRGTRWEPLPEKTPRAFQPARRPSLPPSDTLSEFVAYKVSLYPTGKRWFYLLDLPVESPEGTLIDADFQTTLDKPIDEPQHYEAGSALRYRYGSGTTQAVLRIASEADPAVNPKSAAVARQIRRHFPRADERLAAARNFFRDRNLTYTLRPEPLDLNRTADSFLFDRRKGYCVHFAAAFTTFARLCGLPARIVTGYRADRANSVKNYLAVKERDAHAWTEVYIGKHWQRIDPTRTAKFIDEESLRLLRHHGILGDSRLTKINLYLLYLKYRVETWILNYSHFRQMQLLERLGQHPGFALKFAGAFLLLILVSIVTVVRLRRPPCPDESVCLIKPLLKRLEKRGFVRREGETLHRFLRRCRETCRNAEELDAVDTLYHRIRYGGERELLPDLRREIKLFLRRK